MRKIIVAIILAALFLLNIVAAAFIFLDIQALKFPRATIRVDVIKIDSEEIILHHDLQIGNPNSFDISLENFHILATATDGTQLANVTIEGGLVPGNSNRSFTADDHISLRSDLSGDITSTIKGTVGIKFLGIIQKTIPLEITVLTSLQDVITKISLPSVTIRTAFGTITRHAVNMTAEIDCLNPNLFNLSISDITVAITTDTGKNVGSFMITGSTIPAERSVTLHGQGTILLEALNAKKLLVSLSAQVGVTVAGFTKSLPFSSLIELAIPDLNEFIPKDKPLELALKADLQKARGGLQANVTLEVVNPTKIPLFARDLVVAYYRVTDNQKFFIAESVLGFGELTPEQETVFSGDLFLPYTGIFNFSGGGLLPDMIFAQLRANISLLGVNQSFPVALGSYIDLQPLRLNR